jgi:hypothetical protein
MSNLATRLQAIITQAVHATRAAIRDELAGDAAVSAAPPRTRAVRRAKPAAPAATTNPVVASRGRQTKATTETTEQAKPSQNTTGERKRAIIMCPFEGCGKPGGGPKWAWCCETHKDLPAAERAAARAAQRAAAKQSNGAGASAQP